VTEYFNFLWGFNGEPQILQVQNGRVVSREPSIAAGADAIDLGGAYMLPSFVDAHCHILPMGLDLQKLHLGPFGSHEDVLDAVRDRLSLISPGGWLLAVHYDQTRYEGGRHLTRTELDSISEDTPILLRHVNGHASVVNSAALRAAGVGEDVTNPPGGEFVRDDSGRLTGVLLEHAHEVLDHAVPKASLEAMVEAIIDAGRAMAALGIGTATDMMTGRYNLRRELEAYRLASERGCPVRLRLYVQWSELFGARAPQLSEFWDATRSMNPERCRIAGAKIFADGAIGSATAAIYGRYSGETVAGPVLSRHAKPASSGAPDGVEVSGQLIYAPDRLKNMVLTAHEAGFQIAVHSIGDYATDLVMDAFESTGEPSRHRIEHAMILSDAQIERMAKLNPFCAMQPEFLLRFGHSYKRQLGPERMSRLKRARSVLDAGIRLSLNSDRPIVAGDPWDGIQTAVHRPEGFDPLENITATEALLGYTVEGANAQADGDLGTLDPGALADFTLWRGDPLAGRSELVERA
jgi:predicted amidohydrolase YtcJ